MGRRTDEGTQMTMEWGRSCEVHKDKESTRTRKSRTEGTASISKDSEMSAKFSASICISASVLLPRECLGYETSLKREFLHRRC